MLRLAISCFQTCENPQQIELVFGIDDDDRESIEKAKQLQKQMFPNKISYVVWPRKKYVFSDLMNQCSLDAKGEIFSIMSDDAVYETKGWDEIVVGIFDKCVDKIICVSTSGGQNVQTGFPFMHKNWRTAAGYLLSPIFSGDWGDYWLHDVLAALPGRRHVHRPDIVIKHLHVELGHDEKDETYYEHLKERQAQESLPTEDHPYHGKRGNAMKELEVKNLVNFIKTYSPSRNA